jgi:hypothetical protein
MGAVIADHGCVAIPPTGAAEGGVEEFVLLVVRRKVTVGKSGAAV